MTQLGELRGGDVAPWVRRTPHDVPAPLTIFTVTIVAVDPSASSSTAGNRTIHAARIVSSNDSFTRKYVISTSGAPNRVPPREAADRRAPRARAPMRCARRVRAPAAHLAHRDFTAPGIAASCTVHNARVTRSMRSRPGICQKPVLA